MTPRDRTLDLKSLIEEIECYLAAVELFRAEGHEPRWRADAAVAPGARAKRRKA